MAKKSLSLAEKAKSLRQYGFAVTYGKRGHNKPQNKSAVTRQWRKVSQFLENEKQEFVFQSADKRERLALQKGLNRKQFTPAGFFIRKPRGSKKLPSYKVREDGTIEYKATGPKGGKVIEEIHPIDPKLLAEDPPRAITRLLKKAERKKAKIKLTVNGWDASQTTEYDLDALAFYIATDLLPKFLDPNIDPAYAKLHGRQKRTIADFVDTFHIKIIKHVSPAKTPTRRRRK